jgi:hypothetical protein
MELEKAIIYLQGEAFEITSLLYSKVVNSNVEATYPVVVRDAKSVLEDLNIIPRLDNINGYNELYSEVERGLLNHSNDRIKGIELDYY